MSDDIVDRLNASHDFLGDHLHKEAAEEITRIRRRIDTLEFLAAGADDANFLAAMRAMRNEELIEQVGRLREALKLLHDNVVTAWPSVAELGPVANARDVLATEKVDG